MKKMGLLFLGICVIISCKNDDNSIIDPVVQNKVLLLKVDFKTHAFEEGKELVFETEKDFAISSQYLVAGDFGGVTLLYKDIEEKIFSGTIIWNGTGEIDYPNDFIKSSDFQRINTPVDMPDISTFQKIIYDDLAYYPNIIEYQKIWDTISTLEVLKEYRISNPKSKINLLLYTPSIGILDPTEADWILIIKN